MGRILKVKTGYNPNSSSIGSDILTYFAAAAGAGALTVILLNIKNAASKAIKDNKNDLTPAGKSDATNP